MIDAPQRGAEGITRWYEYSPVDHGKGDAPLRQFQNHKASSFAATVRTDRVFSLAEALDDRNRMPVVAWCESIFRHCVLREASSSHWLNPCRSQWDGSSCAACRCRTLRPPSLATLQRGRDRQPPQICRQNKKDSKSGLDDFGARYNSPRYGRFMLAVPYSASGLDPLDDPRVSIALPMPATILSTTPNQTGETTRFASPIATGTTRTALI